MTENTGFKEKIVISVGGSLIVPDGGIDIDFLTKLNLFIRDQLAKNKNRQFFLVIGGGATTRQYQKAASDVIHEKLARDDVDWLGIHATRLNAHLIRTIFRDIAHQYILKHYEIIRKVTEPVVVASGWKPGWSTDYCSVMVCEDYDVRTVINLSNIKQVYDKDPHKFEDAKPLGKLTWGEMRELVGDDWIPGMHAPFDPIAAAKAQALKVRVVVMSGQDFANVENFLDGKEFLGTVIE